MAKWTTTQVKEIVAAREGLEGENLSRLNLQKANLSGANLSGADLRWADLRAADLNGAFHTADTKWPEGFDPEAAGAVLMEG